MAFIDHDQARVWERSEQGAARPDDNIQGAVACQPPCIVALARREFGMKDANAAWEAAHETGHCLGRERDLWNEDNGLFALCQHFIHRP